MKFKWVNNEVVLYGTPHVREEDGRFWPEAHIGGAVRGTTPVGYTTKARALSEAVRMAESCTTFLDWHRRTTTKGLMLRMKNFPAPTRIIGPFATQDDLDAYVNATLTLEGSVDG